MSIPIGERYEMGTGGMVRCEELTIEINGGEEQGGRTLPMVLPLPNAPEDKYDHIMRQIYAGAKQAVRELERRRGVPDPIRVRIVGKKPTWRPLAIFAEAMRGE